MSQKKDRMYRGELPLFNGPSFEITETIFNFPNKVFHIRGLAKENRLSTTSVIRTINELKKYDIVKIEETSLTTNIRANLESEMYTFYKRIINLYRLERYAIIAALKKTFNPETIVVFGSYAKGEDIEESDIDLMVITPGKDDKDVRDFLKECEENFNRKINLYVLPSLEKSSNEFKNAVANGIVLYGYLKVI